MEDYEMIENDFEAEDNGYLDSDGYYENWDNLEMGFDPYMGCYSDDC